MRPVPLSIVKQVIVGDYFMLEYNMLTVCSCIQQHSCPKSNFDIEKQFLMAPAPDFAGMTQSELNRTLNLIIKC